MRLWAQPMAVVEMEQISRTNLDFISESSLSNIPIWQNLKKTWTRIKECDFFFLFFLGNESGAVKKKEQSFRESFFESGSVGGKSNIEREPRVDFVTWLFFQLLRKCFYRKWFHWWPVYFNFFGLTSCWQFWKKVSVFLSLNWPIKFASLYGSGI